MSCRQRPSAADEVMTRKELGDPVDKDPELVAQVAVRRIDDVEWHRLRRPAREHPAQRSFLQMLLHHEGWRLDDAEAGEPCRHISAAVVDRHDGARGRLMALAVGRKARRIRAAAAGVEVAHELVAVLELRGVSRLAMAREIGRRRTGDEFHLSDPPRHQRLIRQFAAAHHAVDVLAHQVDRPVGHAEVDLDLGVAGMEIRQRRNDDQDRQRAADVDAQPAFCARLRQRHAAVELVDFGEQAHDPLIIGGAVGRDRHTPSGPVQELRVHVRLEQLDQLGDGGLRRVQGRGGAGEGAGLDHPDERPHCSKLIHRAPPFSASHWG